MSRFRITAVATVVAVIAFGTTVVAAQAYVYSVGGFELGSGVKKTLKANAEEAQTQELLGTPFGIAVHVNCTKVETSGELEGLNKGKMGLKYSNCTVVKPPSCTVKPIEANVVPALVGATPEMEFKPETGTTFATITLEGASCSLKGSPFEVTGTQTCKLPSIETSQATHEIECLTTGSSLKMGGKTATFKGGVKALLLQGEELWSVGPDQELKVSVAGGGTECTLTTVGETCRITLEHAKGVEAVDVSELKLNQAGTVFKTNATTEECRVGASLAVGATCAVVLELAEAKAETAKYEFGAKSKGGGRATATATVKH